MYIYELSFYKKNTIGTSSEYSDARIFTNKKEAERYRVFYNRMGYLTTLLRYPQPTFMK